MLSSQSLRHWAWTHKWTSLICTAFMLLLCLTGLPLIFHHEIDHLLGNEIEAPTLPADAPRVDLDHIFAVAQAHAPNKVPQFASLDDDTENFWFVSFANTATSEEGQQFVAVDARTAEILATPKFDEGFIHIMFKLHVDLFAGLPGKLFLGLMGLLLVIAIVSGVVLYAPFMRKLNFGTVRKQRSNRIKWLDLHNVLGIVTVVWALAVGATGVINTWADLVIKYWQFDQMTQLIAPYKNLPPPEKLGSLQQSVAAAEKLLPDKKLSFVAFPGTSFSSPHHFVIFMRGTEPLTSRLLSPVLVDAQTAQITASPTMPWYVTTLLVSQPLHFGDYGGTPLQILWALLDIITIVVLWSGLVLWWRKRKQPIEIMLREAVRDESNFAPALAKIPA
ncbi:MAG: pepsy-associated tm helix protein [Verrucomicrobiaceae bacterium]|nr:pepsy-associated tm helix protein [Verrucomicrobiaceae bacterium]